MSSEQSLTNRVKQFRLARGWSQDDLAARAGVSRAGVSAVETDRLVPSTSAALALAAALECRVEDLFQLKSAAAGVAWAWQPSREPCRYWRASLAGRELLYPTEPTSLGLVAHDGVYDHGRLRELPATAAADTLVIASCDPAIGLLARELAQRKGIRLLAFQRSSREALALLAQGLVHVAGIHWSTAGHQNQNATTAKQVLQRGFSLLRGARWQEGVAFASSHRMRSVRAALESRARWVGREAGSAARELLDKLLPGRRPPRHIARGHRGVAEAICSGWADLGICLRLVSEEAGLGFLSIREEEYDFCYPTELEGDHRIRALVETVRAATYRGTLDDLPGYDAAETGELERIS